MGRASGSRGKIFLTDGPAPTLLKTGGGDTLIGWCVIVRRFSEVEKREEMDVNLSKNKMIRLVLGR